MSERHSIFEPLERLGKLMPSALRNHVRPLVRQQLEYVANSDMRVSAECKRLLALTKRRCPQLFPTDPLKPGQLGAKLLLTDKDVTRILRRATAPLKKPSILWVQGGNSLLIQSSKITTKFTEGSVTLTIPVRCDQTGSATVFVTFVIGSRKREAGMIAATETLPAGPIEITRLWGENLIAFAWDALLRMTSAICAESGKDVDEAGLIPVAMSASLEGLSIQTMARHKFDRRVRL